MLSIISEDKKDLVNQIFSRLNGKMYKISFDILRSHNDAEEAVSQTFLKIMEHIDKISALPSPKIEPYCVVILKHEALNIIRQRKKTVYFEDINFLECDNDMQLIENKFIKIEDRENLLTYIDKLSDQDKYLLHLRYVNELSFKEISNLLDITESAAKKRVQRIISRLRLFHEGGYGSGSNN